jgi:L-ascorbate metabolism protein UlaG (beta-lactamase superfamily)
VPASHKRYLRPSVAAQPLLHRWYAWPYLIAPHTGALNLRDRLLPIMRSYLKAPHLHAAALADPQRYGAPFLDPHGSADADVRELLAATERSGRDRLTLADDIDALRRLLRERATGGSLDSLYAEVPPSLRGCVELGYDLANRPSFRFFEPLLYRTPAFEPHSQLLSLTRTAARGQPFVYSSPVLPGPGRLDIELPFSCPAWDELFGARSHAAEVQGVAEQLGLDRTGAEQFAGFFTDDQPQPYQAIDSGMVRTRYFGHATVLVETGSSAVLLDPLIGYADDGHEHLTVADLPPRIDAVIISHFHSDHFSLETLLQLRPRVGVVLVPRASGGALQDPSLKTMLTALGFSQVRELGELDTFQIADQFEVVALPFLGEHADLDIRTKMVPLVRVLGRCFMFATDTTPIEPAVYDLVRDVIGSVDALFIGLECVGAPLSWLYGPLMESPLSREQDQGRRLKGSDAAMADRIAQQIGASYVYSYAMGLEPWLKHLTGSDFSLNTEQVRQSRLLVDLCARRGVGSELLYRQGERTWPADVNRPAQRAQRPA